MLHRGEFFSLAGSLLEPDTGDEGFLAKQRQMRSDAVTNGPVPADAAKQKKKKKKNKDKDKDKANSESAPTPGDNFVAPLLCATLSVLWAAYHDHLSCAEASLCQS